MTITRKRTTGQLSRSASENPLNFSELGCCGRILSSNESTDSNCYGFDGTCISTGRIGKGPQAQRRGHDGGRHGICGAIHRTLWQSPLQNAGHGPVGAGGNALHGLSFQRHGVFTHPGRFADGALPAEGRGRGGYSSAFQPSGQRISNGTRCPPS